MRINDQVFHYVDNLPMEEIKKISRNSSAAALPQRGNIHQLLNHTPVDITNAKCYHNKVTQTSKSEDTTNPGPAVS